MEGRRLDTPSPPANANQRRPPPGPAPVRNFIGDEARTELQQAVLNRSPHLVNTDMELTNDDESIINELQCALAELAGTNINNP